MTETEPVVTVSNLIKQFGRFAALRGVTAEFSGGKLYAILGDNGAGKTTLLRTLAGLSQPSSGEVTILGASKFHDICQQVGYMAHPSLLYDEMSGMENLAYFARLYGITDRSAAREAIRAGRARSRSRAARRPVFARHAAADVFGAGFSERPQNPFA